MNILYISHNCLDVVRCLLKNGASPSVKNNNGESAIHFVGKRGDKELITTLLSNHEESLNEVDKNHRTALHHACFYGNTTACETLLNHGANLVATTVEGLTPFHIAVMGGYEDVVKLLIKRGTRLNNRYYHLFLLYIIFIIITSSKLRRKFDEVFCH